MEMNDQKKIVLDYIDAVWNRKDEAALKAKTTSDFIYHLGDQLKFDHTAFMNFLIMTHQAFPDWKVKPDTVIAEGSMVAVQWSGEVTHGGIFHGIPPTGKKITVSGINIYKLTEGKIAEEWEQTDTISILRQLGALPG